MKSTYSIRNGGARLHSLFVLLSTSVTAHMSSSDSSSLTPHLDDGLASFSPIPPVRIFRPNSNLEIAFDVRTRNPLYVMERLPRPNPVNSRSIQKRPNFYEENSLPVAFRSRPHHYKRSGYDRGHMAPAADFTTLAQVKDTFNLCNISPQHHGMNVGVWQMLERFVRKVAEDETNQDVYVVTGPIWLPTKRTADNKFEYSFPAMGNPPSLVHVPTHFFKVVVVMKDDSSERPLITKFACFVVPNDENIDKKRKFQDYVVPWSDLEAVTGLEFFPQAMGDDCDRWKLAADAVTAKHLISRRQHMIGAGAKDTTALGMRLPSKSSAKPLSLIGYNLQHLCQNDPSAGGSRSLPKVSEKAPAKKKAGMTWADIAK